MNKESDMGMEATRRGDAPSAGAPMPAEALAVTYTEGHSNEERDETADGAAQEAAGGNTAQHAQNIRLIGKRKRSEHDTSWVQRSCKRCKLSRYTYIEVWHGQESSHGVASTGIT